MSVRRGFPTDSQVPDLDSSITCEVDPEFLEYARREELDQPQLSWEA